LQLPLAGMTVFIKKIVSAVTWAISRVRLTLSEKKWEEFYIANFFKYFEGKSERIFGHLSRCPKIPLKIAFIKLLFQA
jgi:hypothetical protein